MDRVQSVSLQNYWTLIGFIVDIGSWEPTIPENDLDIIRTSVPVEPITTYIRAVTVYCLMLPDEVVISISDEYFAVSTSHPECIPYYAKNL